MAGGRRFDPPLVSLNVPEDVQAVDDDAVQVGPVGRRRRELAEEQVDSDFARRTALIEGEIVTLAPLRNRRKIDGETVVSRIAEGHTRFSWDGVTGYGMTEYIERLDGERLVGYPL